MAAFGSLFMPEMSISWFDGENWSATEIVPSDKLTLHPGAHVLHYSSTCFEGLKAFRHADGSIKIFRMDMNIARFAQSSRLLGLPELDEAQTEQMITSLVAKYAADVPEPPGSMYIRPTHIGTEAAIGKAAVPSVTSCQYVLLSPVAIPTAIPVEPLRSTFGKRAGKTSGSSMVPSKLGIQFTVP